VTNPRAHGGTPSGRGRIFMPRVTTGNTQAPCVIIRERAAEILRSEHPLATPRPKASTRIH
jgi:choline dehydrogenase-like flavoprotein